jgi:succinate-semialdehyde dehydrogenase/glutarate-semialdehyde dehydrogenase
MYRDLKLYINGEWIEGSDTIDVINPATGESLGKLPLATSAELDLALQSANTAFAAWRTVSPVERGRVLRRAADLIRERVDRIASLLTLEQGKVLAEARSEVLASAEIFDWFAEECRRSYGRVIPSRDARTRQFVVLEPVGPVAAFSPWNFPAVAPARKVAAALAAGCSCILKPSEETPATALELALALEDAGLPKGTLNVVFGVPDIVSRHLIASEIIRKVSFTGSVGIGKHLARLAADGLKRVTLELGGHAPVVVCADADVEQAARLTAAAKFRNAGQVCISPSRFFVHQDVQERFLNAFVGAARGLKTGDGMAGDSTMGPVANERRLSAMNTFLEDAVQKGGTLQCGGQHTGNRGFFFEPTVISDVPGDALIMNNEPFGPIAPVATFADLDELLSRANGLKYGLAAYVFTQSTASATRLSNGIEAGMIGVNHLAISHAETPFGGVRDSGMGHEGGIEGLEAYMQRKFISQI